jgi:uncharacterized SAM-binding protein YcdF (DUF218 family)
MAWMSLTSSGKSQKKNKWGVGFGFGLTLILLLGFFLIQADELYDFQDTVDGVHLPEVDAIVVLAGGRGRIAAAGDLWYRYWSEADTTPGKSTPIVPLLYVSGMGPTSTWAALERQVHRGILPFLDRKSVILETESTNTIENARVLARFAREYQWKRILLMTSSYHMKRSRMVFEQVLTQERLAVGVETFTFYHDPFDPDEWFKSVIGIEVTLLEYWKWLYTRWVWLRSTSENS